MWKEVPRRDKARLRNSQLDESFITQTRNQIPDQPQYLLLKNDFRLVLLLESNLLSKKEGKKYETYFRDMPNLLEEIIL
ncbi:hypothetical protein NPIL_367191 [Nephila pilipes]|uniref:Uncharacterized protein n=1 Tax=Nephila pilipes TaxID=299642 RepID=A0A8X6P3E9_NEPPI|nr:hypothetical protein NPIL_648831 [Nephila pilipes]GFT21890.1 hypothetical protein NPIL_116621 [Nephila pilipes]GFT44800.1 hypothetical protein NPIL_396111 [Nephila pilipes]GFU23757.1 hypothetical protein NPIL_367191 [Nephila pilipes]